VGEKEAAQTSITCPYCGGPQRNLVPSNVAQVKCDYCGRVFPISPYFKGAVPRCPNHPDAFATGLCNDCGENFCTKCLQEYNLNSQNETVRLYLCHDCTLQRNLEKTNSIIFVGIGGLLLGLFILLFSPLAGILLVLLFSLPLLGYGIYKRSSIISEEQGAYEERETVYAREEAEKSFPDAEILYSKMLSKYAVKWGVINAKELLDSEIRAYVRDGLGYSEAVYRVALAKGLVAAGSTEITEKNEDPDKDELPKEFRNK
jgi:hypothetical protein